MMITMQSVRKVAQERGMEPDKVMEHLRNAASAPSGSAAQALAYLAHENVGPTSAAWTSTPNNRSMVGKLAAQHRLALETAIRGLLPPDEPKA